jgi:hypothetical protein
MVGVWALGAGLGALAGWIWALTAPRVLLEYFASGPVPEGYQEEGYISSDGIAALLMVGVGMLLAAVLIPLRPRAPLQVLGLGVVGALLAAVPLWGIVTAVHAAEVAAFPTGLVDGALVEAPRDIRMAAVYLLGAITVALIATVQAAALWVIPRRTVSPE